VKRRDPLPYSLQPRIRVVLDSIGASLRPGRERLVSVDKSLDNFTCCGLSYLREIFERWVVGDALDQIEVLFNPRNRTSLP
jgi:hypothetical protein